jgi:hypothetical protein
MEEHHWGGKGWNPAVEPEEEEFVCGINRTLYKWSAVERRVQPFIVKLKRW